MYKAIGIIGAAGLIVSASAFATSFTPEIQVTCEAITFSHAPFKSAFGESVSMKYSVNGGDKVIIENGELVTLTLEEQFSQGDYDIQVFANYENVAFDHSIGRFKPSPADCEVELPEEEEQLVETEIPVEEEVPAEEENPVEEETPVTQEEEPKAPAVKPTPPVKIETARA